MEEQEQDSWERWHRHKLKFVAKLAQEAPPKEHKDRGVWLEGVWAVEAVWAVVGGGETLDVCLLVVRRASRALGPLGRWSQWVPLAERAEALLRSGVRPQSAQAQQEREERPRRSAQEAEQEVDRMLGELPEEEARALREVLIEWQPNVEDAPALLRSLRSFHAQRPRLFEQEPPPEEPRQQEPLPEEPRQPKEASTPPEEPPAPQQAPPAPPQQAPQPPPPPPPPAGGKNKK